MNISAEKMHNSYLSVELELLRQNIRAASASLSVGAKIIPVLKCDAYGLGIERVAKAIEGMDEVCMPAVAHVSEGLDLRRCGIKKPILVLNHPIPTALGAAAEAGLTLTVGRLGLLPQLSALGIPFSVQLKLDTGLHRVGVAVGDELSSLLSELRACGDAVTLTGVFSHFADTADAQRCAAQYALYMRGVEQIEAAGFSVPMRHICDSAASENYPEYHLDAVRLGRRLMMDHPTAPRGDIRECASWHCFVTGITQRHAGDTLGYADAYRLEKDATVAILSVGYGDGLPIPLVEAHGSVLLRGRRCPLLACCMDQCFIDVTGTEAAIGDEVTVFGRDDLGNELTAQEQSAVFGGNEGCGITSMLSCRVARVYSDR